MSEYLDQTTPTPDKGVVPWRRQAREAICAAPVNLLRSGYRTRADAPPTALVEDCVMTALMFLALGPVQRLKSKSCANHEHSYGLKHLAEDWGRAAGLEPYVANGELIAAALYLGFTVTLDPGTPNAFIGVRTAVDHGGLALAARSRETAAQEVESA